MAAYEVLLLNTAIPQIQAAQSGDTYVVPRDIAFSAALTLSAGTANGIPYLNGSKVLTSSSALQFDGANLGLGVAPSAWTDYRALQVGSLGSIAFDGGSSMEMFSNVYYASGAFRYISSSATAKPTRYAQGNGVHYWYNAPSGTAGNAITFTQAMTLDASGNLALGKTSASCRLDVTGSGSTPVTLERSDGTYVVALKGTGTTVAAALGMATNDMVIAVNNTERARITSGGDLLVAKQAINNTVVGVENRADGSTFSTLSASVDATTTSHVYSTGAGAYRFYVGLGGTVYATNTTISAISDQRLKENIQDLDVGLSKIMALKPRKFDWKEGKGKNIKGDRGWIAQEFEQVFPDMIDEWKDPAPEGEEPYKSVRADLIPVLVKAIQELKAEVDSLKAQLEAK